MQHDWYYWILKCLWCWAYWCLFNGSTHQICQFRLKERGAVKISESFYGEQWRCKDQTTKNIQMPSSSCHSHLQHLFITMTQLWLVLITELFGHYHIEISTSAMWVESAFTYLPSITGQILCTKKRDFASFICLTRIYAVENSQLLYVAIEICLKETQKAANISFLVSFPYLALFVRIKLLNLLLLHQ